MYLNEAKSKQEKDDLAIIIREVLEQRIQGTKNESGVFITPSFPKLLYVLEEDNIEESSEYYWLTKLAAKCTAKRMVPDYISEKIMLRDKGYCYPCMGAARGDEIVSIKVNDVEFNDIPIKEAFNIIRASTPIHGGGFHAVSELKEVFYHKCGVYKITHIPSGKYYIGSSKDIYRRLIEHKTKCTHMGTLGELYFINDFNPDNFKYELLKECDIDDLWNIEAEYIDLNDPNCVNHKDSRFNGNFNIENVKLGSAGKKYSDYINRAYTWVKDVSNFEIFVKSKEEWKKILKITYNDHRKCPLKLYEISIDRNGVTQKIHVTEDHPFHTERGRVETKDLLLSDRLFSPNLTENYKIVSIVEDTEDYDTYDFEVDNDIFNLSGILSHNCRSFLTPDRWSEKYGNLSNSNTFDEYKGHIFYGRLTLAY